MTTKQFQLRLTDAEMTALKEEAAREGVSMHEVAVTAINEHTHRRERYRTLMARTKAKHAPTLAALADR